MEGLVMLIAGGNILADIPSALAKEQFIELLSAPHLRIERIVSIGHSSPPGHFDDQDWSERVLVQPSAIVALSGQGEGRRTPLSLRS
jgi:cupin 2 domain-containing protein